MLGFPLLLAVVLWSPVGLELAGGTDRGSRRGRHRRSFSIEGDVPAQRSGRLLSLYEVRLGNPDWARRNNMGCADALHVAVALSGLWRREITLLRIGNLLLSLERNDMGDSNWRFPAAAGRSWDVVDLQIDEARMELIEPEHGIELWLRIGSGEPRREMLRSPLLLRGDGIVGGVALAVSGGIESPLQLRDQDRPFRLMLRIESAESSARLRGSSRSWIDPGELDLELSIQGTDLAELFPLLRIALPPSRHYELEGQLKRDGNHWQYLGIQGSIGESDIAGDLTVDHEPDGTSLYARLHSTRLDFLDLAGFSGMAPGQIGDREAAGPRVIPDVAYSRERLMAMDADVIIRGPAIAGRAVPR